MHVFNLKTLVRVSRPRLWLYLFGPYVIGLVAGAPHFAHLLDWRVFLYAVYFLWPANLLAYGVNDLFDYETDRLDERRVERGLLVEPALHSRLIRTIVVSQLPFVLLLLLATNIWTVAAFSLFLFFTIFYSAPPIRAKNRPILDSVFNALYVMPGVIGFYLAGGTDLRWAAVAAGVLWSMAMHVYDSLPDQETDKAAGIHTTVIWLGSRVSMIFCFGLYMAAAILGSLYFGNLSRILGVLYATLMVLSFKQRSAHDFMVVYNWLPLVNAMTGLSLLLATVVWRMNSSP